MRGESTENIAQGPPPDIPIGWGGGDDESSDGSPGASRRASTLMLYLLLVSSSMVFLAFGAAFVMRRSVGNDWVSTPKPHILWFSTAVIMASSGILEIARHKLRSGSRTGFNRWWTGATVMGIVFLLAQALAWRQMKLAGFYMASNPSTSFFYMFTATHAVHVVGAITALIYVDVHALGFRLGPAKRTAIDLSAIFWHFLDVLWLGLMALLYLWG